MADLGVMTKTDFKESVKNRLTKWTDNLQPQIVKDVDSTFDDTLQVCYLNPINGLKSTMLNVLKQAFGKVVRFSLAPTVSEAEMRSLVQTKAEADTTV